MSYRLGERERKARAGRQNPPFPIQEFSINTPVGRHDEGETNDGSGERVGSAEVREMDEDTERLRDYEGREGPVEQDPVRGRRRQELQGRIVNGDATSLVRGVVGMSSALYDSRYALA